MASAPIEKAKEEVKKNEGVRVGSRSFHDALFHQRKYTLQSNLGIIHPDFFGDGTNQIGECGESKQRLVVPLTLSAPIVPTNDVVFLNCIFSSTLFRRADDDRNGRRGNLSGACPSPWLSECDEQDDRRLWLIEMSHQVGNEGCSVTVFVGCTNIRAIERESCQKYDAPTPR